jgi:hypothetical protein
MIVKRIKLRGLVKNAYEILSILAITHTLDWNWFFHPKLTHGDTKWNDFCFIFLCFTIYGKGWYS